jgi:alkylation response protein AidB-like acyl-CoA dehydrogenase
MANDLFSTPEHALFRETVRKFVDDELRPRAREFDAAGRFDKSLYKKMGDLGMLGLRYDPKWGGAGLDYSYMAILFEEIGRCDNAGVAMGISVHTDMATPSLHQVRQRRAEAAVSRARDRGRVCVLRSRSPSRARAPTSPRSRRARCATATSG